MEAKERAHQKQDLREYYTWGLTLLQLMSVLAITGLVLKIITDYFFS